MSYTAQVAAIFSQSNCAFHFREDFFFFLSILLSYIPSWRKWLTTLRNGWHAWKV